jgi:hypothetical protein
MQQHLAWRADVCDVCVRWRAHQLASVEECVKSGMCSALFRLHVFHRLVLSLSLRPAAVFSGAAASTTLPRGDVSGVDDVDTAEDAVAAAGEDKDEEMGAHAVRETDAAAAATVGALRCITVRGAVSDDCQLLLACVLASDVAGQGVCAMARVAVDARGGVVAEMRCAAPDGGRASAGSWASAWDTAAATPPFVESGGKLQLLLQASLCIPTALAACGLPQLLSDGATSQGDDDAPKRKRGRQE